MKSFLLAFPLLIFALAASGQELIEISPLVSFDYGSPLFINRTPGVFNQSTAVDSGVSTSFSYGLGAQGAMGLIGPIGLIGRITGVYTAGEFTGRDTISGHEWKLLAEALAEWKLSAFSLRAGPWVSERLLGTVFANHPGSFFGSSQSPGFHYGVAAGVGLDIKYFPIEPELTTHLDLGELSEAGSNAWSVGLSIAYPLGVNKKVEAPFSSALPALSVIPPPPPFSASVKFFVNGSAAQGSPLLERVETRIKDYAIVDSANAAPRITQWDEESYHLPHLALSIAFLRGSGAVFTLSKDSIPLLKKTFSRMTDSTSRIDTVLDLDKDSAWHKILSLLNTSENNRLLAELRTDSETVRDTLVLPPADTSRATLSRVNQEFRFELSDNFGSYAGGAQSLNLLLDRMKELLDSTNTIRIQEGVSEQNLPSHAALEKRLANVLGTREIERETSADVHKGLVVILEW